MIIKKVYWYCPMCNYSTSDQPMGTHCIACSHDDFSFKPSANLNYTMNEILTEQLERARKEQEFK